jgi:RNA polymerase sigma-70 factor (ECF subfamily)
MTLLDTADDDAIAAAFTRGDPDAFDIVSRRHFRELHVHCYRMVGSFDEAEDLVQETLLRGWHRRDSYAGRAPLRAWLYRIATNVCIDALRSRRALDAQPAMPDAPRYAELPWLQPYPDALLGSAAPPPAPDAQVIMRDSIELAFLATIQLLPPKQRAALLLRDVLDFSAAEAAEILEDSTAAVNSALQRARETVQKKQLSRTALSPSKATFDDAAFLQLFMDAQVRGDLDTIIDLLREDVRMTLLPQCETWEGREDVAREFRRRYASIDADIRTVPTAANRQPAVAVYTRAKGDTEFRAWGIVVLGASEGKLYEIATFTQPEVFARFELPLTLTGPPAGSDR